MCKLVPVLRVIGFVFLVLAIVTLAIGYVSPFWIRLPLDRDEETTTVAPRSTTQKLTTPLEGLATTPTTAGLGFPDVGNALSGLLSNGSYEGLWAKCFHNFTQFSCSCFWQNNFAMEKQFPGTEYSAYAINSSESEQPADTE